MTRPLWGDVMTTATLDIHGAREPVGVKTPKKAALASWIGSALEYYDFFIYGTGAALVFGKIFFPSSHAATGLLLALATFGVGYVARPIGAFFLGHVGDKFGRKTVLVFTLILMDAEKRQIQQRLTFQRHPMDARHEAGHDEFYGFQ